MIDLTPYTDSNGDIDLKKELIQNLAEIVTSGSNPNGSYIRFSDGTQICWGSVTASLTSVPWVNLSATEYVGFTFASSFVAIPICTMSFAVSTGGSGWLVGSANNTTGGSCFLVRPDSIQLTGILYFMAIGRWK